MDAVPASTRASTSHNGIVVASFETYPEAVQAIASLSRHDFPIERVTIVGRGLALVEQVTSRTSGLQATLGAAAWSALSGGFLGFLIGAISTPFAGLVLMFWGALFGIVIGAVLGWLRHRAARGSDFESMGGVRAERFDIVVGEAYAEEAEALVDAAQRPSATSTR